MKEADPLAWVDLGRRDFAETAALQESLRGKILAGDASAERLLFVEHAPVVTLGTRGKADDVLADADELSRRGIAVARTTRGGEVTFHGPGQIVIYPVLRLRRGIVEHVRAMADAIVEVAAAHGVSAEFRRACPGVWVGDAKLAAFGVHVHRRVAVHGAAFNVDVALDAFDLIVPCGVRGCRVTSLAHERGGTSVPRAQLIAELATALCRHFERTPVPACA